MEDNQKRILDEYRDINDRIKKLNRFIATNPKYKELESYKKFLLNKQIYAMIFYCDTLSLRLKAEGVDMRVIAKKELNDLNKQA